MSKLAEYTVDTICDIGMSLVHFIDNHADGLSIVWTLIIVVVLVLTAPIWIIPYVIYKLKK